MCLYYNLMQLRNKLKFSNRSCKNIITKNVCRTKGACSKSSLQDLQDQVHRVVDGEGPDEADECEIEDADHKSHTSSEAIGDVPRDGQHQQSAHAVQGAR